MRTIVKSHPLALAAMLCLLLQPSCRDPKSSAPDHAKDSQRQPNTPTAEQMVACLADHDPYVRQNAAAALGRIGDARAVEPLLACLKDENEESIVRSAAAQALAKLGKPAVDPLIACLKLEDGYVRWRAAEALGNLRDAKAVGPLMDCLKDDDVDLRRNAAEALGKLGDARAVGPLIGCFTDENNDVRSDAARALGKLGTPAFDPLLACLKDPNPVVRWWAAEALGWLGDARAIRPLFDVLPDWDTSKAIGSALGKLGWKPTSEQETVYWWICIRSDQAKKQWDMTKRVMLADVKSGERKKIENAVCVLMSMGRQDVIADLIDILNSQGDVILADTYLNCGNKELDQAARKWDAAHGYKIVSGGSGGKAAWGSW